jgi:hypothetical protein
MDALSQMILVAQKSPNGLFCLNKVPWKLLKCSLFFISGSLKGNIDMYPIIMNHSYQN